MQLARPSTAAAFLSTWETLKFYMLLFWNAFEITLGCKRAGTRSLFYTGILFYTLLTNLSAEESRENFHSLMLSCFYPFSCADSKYQIFSTPISNNETLFQFTKNSLEIFLWGAIAYNISKYSRTFNLWILICCITSCIWIQHSLLWYIIYSFHIILISLLYFEVLKSCKNVHCKDCVK